MELIAKGLRRSQQFHVLSFSCISGENRRAGKSKQVIILECLNDFSMHLSELAAVTLIKDNNRVLSKYLMSLVLRDKVVQLLDGRDDNFIRIITAFFVSVFKLSLQYSGRSIAVGRAFLKAVIFFHGLIIQVFSINYKQNLVHIGKCGGKLCCLKGGQRFSTSRGVPDISSCIRCSHLLVVGGYVDAVQDTLSRRNLIGTHHHQDILCRKNTILGQYIQNRMLGKKGFCKIYQVGNHLIVAVCPEGSKLKAIAGFLRFLLCRFTHLHDMAVPGGIGVILGVRSIGNDENLHILIQTACRKEAVSLITFNLIKGFPDSNATAFQLYMDKRQTIDQNGHVIACVVSAFGFFILVDNLKAVIVNILFVNKLKILGSSIIPAKHLHMIGLHGAAFLYDTLVRISKRFRKEPLPLTVGKSIIIQNLQLFSKVGNQTVFIMDCKVLVPLHGQQTDEFLFQSLFALEAVRA